MADQYEGQADLGDEAADNFPADFGRLYDPSIEPARGRYAVLGAAGARQQQAVRFAVEGQRALLAADLLRANAGLPAAEWSDVAAKALAAATIIYPDPKEAE